jgi:hypothetical protein
MPPKRNRPLTTQEAERMERDRRWKELPPSIRESPHIEAQSLLSLMEKGKLQSGEGSSGYCDEFFFFIMFLFVHLFFLLLYNSLTWNKMFQSRRSHDGFAGSASLPKNGGGDPEPVGHISMAQRGKHSLIVLTCIGVLAILTYVSVEWFTYNGVFARMARHLVGILGRNNPIFLL